MAGQNFTPGSAAVPSSQVEISVSCRNLKDKDAFSKSDPICVMFMWDQRGKMYHEYGRTEMVKNNLNPDFVHKFIVQYFFEESQKLKYEIYDVDAPTARLDAHDFLGRIECTLGEIVGCCSGRLEKNLIGVPGGSKILVRVEELTESKEVVTIQFRGTGLDKKDFFGKSDPFLIIKKANDLDKTFTAVHKTEVIKNTLNPTWAPIKLSVRTLCNGDYKRLLRIECYDWDSDGGHDTIGSFTTTLKDLNDAAKSGQMLDVINEHKKAKKRNYKNSGELNVMSCKIEIVPTFLDFLKGGMEMNFTVAIDFTASNGNPSQSNSLHFLSPHAPNQYATTIQAVGEIIQDYDTDKLFPVLGFGARLPGGTVSHEFPCNLNPQNPYCAGIEGIMQAYYTSLRQVQLYGPTNFSPVINHVAKFASAKMDGSNYFVLLIITDGVISDMPHTIQSIVQASRLPMSIIIVGVGDADFDAMDVLDADGKRLGIEGRYAERDIVQFVPIREFLARGHGDVSMSKAALAKAVLAEVPDQVIQFMKRHSIQPKPPRIVPPSQQPNVTAPGQAPLPGQGQPPYQGQQPGQGQQTYPNQGQGQAPYPNQGQAPYPNQGQGQAPYPNQGQAPYSNQGQGQPPHPNQGQGQAPYPNQGQGSAPYPNQGQGQAPYPNQGQAPYPTGGQGSAPYPTGGQGSAPNPTGQGSAPNPTGQGSAPYPTGSQGQAPYPTPGQGTAPYPTGGQGSAPYPTGGQGSAPYPIGGQGSAPYPTGGQGSAPYPTGGQGSAPYPNQGQTPYLTSGQGSAPYPTGGQGSAPYPTSGPGQQRGPPPQRPPPPSYNNTK